MSRPFLGEEKAGADLAVDEPVGDEVGDLVLADVLEYDVPVDVKPPPASATISEKEFDRLTAD